MSSDSASKALDDARNAVMVKSTNMSSEAKTVQGYDFNKGLDYDTLLQSMLTTGYQATHFGRAVDIVNKMITWRLSQETKTEEDIEAEEAGIVTDRENTKTTIFLGYTSNLISSGLREIIRFLCEHKMIDCIVTTAGGIEEDFIKCLCPTYLGEFSLQGSALREKGLNRIGNLLVPNDNYVAFESWVTPILTKMLSEQKKDGVVWTPSKIIRRLGLEINNPESVYYWCAKNDIPVFCPAITDGSLGDMMFFHSSNHPGLVIDILGDLRDVNHKAMFAKKTGAIILGGGIVKHHICNANLMRNGTDYAVYINTAQEFDGSDAGASPDEAVSWGKITTDAMSVKVSADATLIFPLLVAQTFAKHHFAKSTNKPQSSTPTSANGSSSASN